MTSAITERLRLALPRADDLDAYVAVFTHPAVRTWLRPEPEPPATRTDIEAMVAGDIELWERLGYGPWAVFDRRDGAFLGRVGLQPRPLPDEEAIEAVWTIDPARHGEGLATEAAWASIELARGAAIAGLVALVQPTNLASRAVAEKVGFLARGKIEHAGLPHLIYRLSLA